MRVFRSWRDFEKHTMIDLQRNFSSANSNSVMNASLLRSMTMPLGTVRNRSPRQRRADHSALTTFDSAKLLRPRLAFVGNGVAKRNVTFNGSRSDLAVNSVATKPPPADESLPALTSHTTTSSTSTDTSEDDGDTSTTLLPTVDEFLLDFEAAWPAWATSGAPQRSWAQVNTVLAGAHQVVTARVVHGRHHTTLTTTTG